MTVWYIYNFNLLYTDTKLPHSKITKPRLPKCYDPDHPTSPEIPFIMIMCYNVKMVQAVFENSLAAMKESKGLVAKLA